MSDHLAGSHVRNTADDSSPNLEARSQAADAAPRGGYKICRQGHVFRGFDITCPYCSLLKAKGGRGPKLR